jgi:hypothetical protein
VDAAGGADVDEVEALEQERLGAVHVVPVVAVAAVDDRVAGLEVLDELVDDLLDERRRHHDPDRARLVELPHQVRERARAGGALGPELRHGVRIDVEDDDLVPVLHQAARHVCAHPPESDHSQLHGRPPVYRSAVP